MCVLVRTLSEAKCKYSAESNLHIKRIGGGGCREDLLVHIAGKFKVMLARMTGTPSTKKVSGFYYSLHYSRLCFFSALASFLVRISLDYSSDSSRITLHSLSSGNKIPLF